MTPVSAGRFAPVGEIVSSRLCDTLCASSGGWSWLSVGGLVVSLRFGEIAGEKEPQDGAVGGIERTCLAVVNVKKGGG